MPRQKPQFRHEVKWAPDNPDMNTHYSARMQTIQLKRGKITVVWTIYKSYTKGKKEAAK
jgi:hypothetical protein